MRRWTSRENHLSHCRDRKDREGGCWIARAPLGTSRASAPPGIVLLRELLFRERLRMTEDDGEVQREILFLYLAVSR
jgi:hypothetical protein